jgi:hypothetical protein
VLVGKSGDNAVTNTLTTPSSSPAVAGAQIVAQRRYFNYQKPVFTYEPFPVGIISPVIEESLYSRLVDSFPDVSLCKLMPYLGNKKSVKYSLAEKNNTQQYYDFLAGTPVWKGFHDWVKSPDFLYRTLEMLSANNIELGYYNPAQQAENKTLIERVRKTFLIRRYGHTIPLSARFEFSILPADGGQLQPHTDSPGKVITLVVSMVRPDEWNQSWGGSTDMLRPKRTEQNFNWVNRYLEYDEVETIASYAFQPNQALVFIKTFNSWHCVKPMTGTGSKALRRTLTINIEARE